MSPEQNAEDYATLELAFRYFAEQPALKASPNALANGAAMSEPELEQVLNRWSGVGLGRFLQLLSTPYLKSHLAHYENVYVEQALVKHAVESTSKLLTFAPESNKEVSKGLPICYSFHSTRFGLALIALAPEGVCSLGFHSPQRKVEELAALQDNWPGAIFTEDPDLTLPVADAINLYPNNYKFEFPIWVRATPFQARVWRLLMDIPTGGLVTYQCLGNIMGQPDASRAVGTAVGANPVAFFIPCHRVIRASAALGGFRWGLTRKHLMLAWEHAQLPPLPSTPNLFS